MAASLSAHVRLTQTDGRQTFNTFPNPTCNIYTGSFRQHVNYELTTNHVLNYPRDYAYTSGAVDDYFISLASINPVTEE
jgi:hypothetical protein